MKKHVQIRDSYDVWHPEIMHRAIHIEAIRNGIGEVVVTDALIIEWLLHNIGYYLTLPFVKNPKIKALNERFKHVDLMVEVVECE